MTDGKPGVCSGHFEISGTHMVRRLYQDTYSRQSQSMYVDAIKLSIVSHNGLSTSYKVGDEIPLHDGDTGITDFTATDDPQFANAVSKFTDGVNEWIAIKWDLLDDLGYPHGGGSAMKGESSAFHTGSDLVGHSIDMMRRDVTGLTIQPTGGDHVDYSFDVTWSFWEYPTVYSPYWMWVSPAFDDLGVGISQRVTVTFSAMELMSGTTALLPGVYTSTLLIDPGESRAPPILVPVTMVVAEPYFIYLPIVTKNN